MEHQNSEIAPIVLSTACGHTVIIILRQNTPFLQCGFTDFHHTDHFLNCATELVHTGSDQERYREYKYTTVGTTYSKWQEKKERMRARRKGELTHSQI